MTRIQAILVALVATMGALLAAQAIAAEKSDVTINGAGATFPFPVYSQWAADYEKVSGVKLNYQSIGSGGGIAQIKAKTVDFGASDAPMKSADLKAAGLMQFPMIVGGVVPIVNVKGVEAGKFNLSPFVLAEIMLGNISTWNDPKIVELNPGLTLPELPITVVHRADGSGTTWIFTNYLSAVSKTWKEKVGADKAVNWPTGVGGKGNEGVAAYVQRVDGSIGYVEYAYALQAKLAYANLKNQAGKTVAPSIDSFQAAAASADWKNAPDYFMVLVDQPGDNSWPIAGASFIIIYKSQVDAAKAKTMLEFFDWSLKNGTAAATKLAYVPLPDSLVKMIEESWAKDVKTADGKALWK
jgi:phosphate transport system substrate-binding protein